MSNWRSEIFLSKQAEAMADRTVLVAGCGADGSHAAETLASFMMHAPDTTLILADPDTYAEGNLGIQLVGAQELGKNKAEVTARKIDDITGQSVVTRTIPDGVTLNGVSDLLEGVDYVVDATDISVAGDIAPALHREAAIRRIPVVVPWSLGTGSAMVACTENGQFDEWTKTALLLGEKYGLEGLGDLTRWLVDVPEGLTLGYIQKLLIGEAPTPTTYIGAARGGHQAALWITEHACGHRPPEYDDVVIEQSRGLAVHTRIERIAEAIRGSLRQLVDL